MDGPGPGWMGQGPGLIGSGPPGRWGPGPWVDGPGPRVDGSGPPGWMGPGSLGGWGLAWAPPVNGPETLKSRVLCTRAQFSEVTRY